MATEAVHNITEGGWLILPPSVISRTVKVPWVKPFKP